MEDRQQELKKKDENMFVRHIHLTKHFFFNSTSVVEITPLEKL